MKLSLAQIEAFYWIARLGGFREAASYLNITQPTVSLRIRGLETTIGGALFERRGRRAVLSAEGTRLLSSAERMIALAQEFDAGRRAADPLSGQLRLGAPDSFGLTCMPSLLRALRLQYPKLNIALTINNSMALCDQLNERNLDIAFLADPQVASYVKTELLGTMRLGWVASSRLHLPKIVRPSDLVRHDVLTNPQQSNLMQLVHAWFAGGRHRPAYVSTCNSLSVIVRLVAAGAGVALLPVAILPQEHEAAGLRVLKTVPQVPAQKFFAAYLGEKAGPSVEALLMTGRQVLRQSTLLI